MESLYMNHADTSAGSSSASSDSFASLMFSSSSPSHRAPSITSTSWNSPSNSISTDVASPSPSDDFVSPPAASTGFPEPQLASNWDILDDLFINDALSALPPVSELQQSQNEVKNDHNVQGEVTPASPYSGAFPGGYSSSSSASSVTETKTKLSRPSVKVTGAQKTIKSSTIRGRGKGRGRAVEKVKVEPLTLEEQKKQKRRSQIASSVQRHREKKKNQVSALQTDLSRLTAQLASMRAERRAQLADNDQLVAYQEEAMTQRRKRKQAEETNQNLKQALFQQTAFLGGMQSLMRGGNLPCSKELEFQDWVHSYTALASRDALARRKEYVAHFTRSKMDLANKLVIKDTEAETQRLLATGQVYSARVRILHDGTRDFEEMPSGLEMSMMRELFGRQQGNKTDDAADGCVVKQFSAVFLFKETAKVTLDRLQDAAFASMRGIGLYYPGAGYESRALDQVDVQDQDQTATNLRVYYTGLSASMDPTYEVLDKGQDQAEITVEARVLCCEQRGRDGGMLLLDYVDEDALCPLPADLPGQKMIRRNCCGGVVVRREADSGMLSMRVACVKSFCPLEKKKNIPNTLEDEEARRAVARRIGLQATECERLKDRCTGYVFRTVANQLGVTACI